MPSQSDWLPLSKAFDRLDAVATRTAQDIIARGHVPIMAIRSDTTGSITPERVETLLVNATRAELLRDTVTALYAPGQDSSILGPRSNITRHGGAQPENVVAWRYAGVARIYRLAEQDVCSIDDLRHGGAALIVRFRSARVYWPMLIEALAAAGFKTSVSERAGARARPPARERQSGQRRGPSGEQENPKRQYSPRDPRDIERVAKGLKMMDEEGITANKAAATIAQDEQGHSKQATRDRVGRGIPRVKKSPLSPFAAAVLKRLESPQNIPITSP